MSTQSTTSIRKAWLRWKSLRLPWRKKFLVGLDLSGNTYWEFKDSLSSKRLRRIVQYPSNVHYSDVSSLITPAWHQWLRHTRYDPPSLQEQAQDVVRQKNLKTLAAQADARWAAKPRISDMPGREEGQPLPPFDVNSSRESAREGEIIEDTGEEARKPVSGGAASASEAPLQRQISDHEVRGKEEPAIPKQKETLAEENPWKRARGGPSEEWQPQAWNPSAPVTKKR